MRCLCVYFFVLFSLLQGQSALLFSSSARLWVCGWCELLLCFIISLSVSAGGEEEGRRKEEMEEQMLRTREGRCVSERVNQGWNQDHLT